MAGAVALIQDLHLRVVLAGEWACRADHEGTSKGTPSQVNDSIKWLELGLMSSLEEEVDCLQRGTCDGMRMGVGRYFICHLWTTGKYIWIITLGALPVELLCF
jgi:hypothetical protein